MNGRDRREKKPSVLFFSRHKWDAPAVPMLALPAYDDGWICQTLFTRLQGGLVCIMNGTHETFDEEDERAPGDRVATDSLAIWRLLHTLMTRSRMHCSVGRMQGLFTEPLTAGVCMQCKRKKVSALRRISSLGVCDCETQGELGDATRHASVGKGIEAFACVAGICDAPEAHPRSGEGILVYSYWLSVVRLLRRRYLHVWI
ncbi:hypothetical protein V8C42DRAFT_319880 [Trichoderma barbatum]